MNRRNKNPEPIRDSMHDLHEQMEKLSKEMHVIKKMIEEQNSSERKKSLLP
jgi:ppGpp synthetase/RelA/SpoT-type nucleotidyltranferase